MSSISAGTTVGTALVSTGDTTGDLVFKTGSSATTALTISGTDQSITVAGGLNLGAPVAVASGGTGASTAANARTNLGLAIGTDVLAPNGSGANLTSLNASNISSGTLAVAQGGTGATTLTANNVLLGNGTSAVQVVAPGTNGNVLTSNGTTWVSSAPSGGVTSLNGQTGAITNTTFNAIGSYTAGIRFGGSTVTNAGDTLSGSSIYQLNGGSVDGPFIIFQNSQVSTNLSKTGTWRAMAYTRNSAPNCCGNYNVVPNIWVRIS